MSLPSSLNWVKRLGCLYTGMLASLGNLLGKIVARFVKEKPLLIVWNIMHANWCELHSNVCVIWMHNQHLIKVALETAVWLSVFMLVGTSVLYECMWCVMCMLMCSYVYVCMSFMFVYVCMPPLHNNCWRLFFMHRKRYWYLMPITWGQCFDAKVDFLCKQTRHFLSVSAICPIH